MTHETRVHVSIYQSAIVQDDIKTPPLLGVDRELILTILPNLSGQGRRPQGKRAVRYLAVVIPADPVYNDVDNLGILLRVLLAQEEWAAAHWPLLRSP